MLDRNVENLSGGELQRFAIAVVAAQEGEAARRRSQRLAAKWAALLGWPTCRPCAATSVLPALLAALV